MQRFNRNVPTNVRNKIADSMRKYHANRTATEKEQTALKQSNSQKRYWASIPKEEENNNETREEGYYEGK